MTEQAKKIPEGKVIKYEKKKIIRWFSNDSNDFMVSSLRIRQKPSELG